MISAEGSPVLITAEVSFIYGGKETGEEKRANFNSAFNFAKGKLSNVALALHGLAQTTSNAIHIKSNWMKENKMK